MTKPESKRPGGKGGGSVTKMRVTAAWQGDKKTAEKDMSELKKAWRKGGFDAVYKKKTELRDKRFGR